jgi:hypothetical protein
MANPKWWNEEHDSTWERVLRRDLAHPLGEVEHGRVAGLRDRVKWNLKFVIPIVAIIALIGLGVVACTRNQSDSNKEAEKLNKGIAMQTVTSKDGTRIAYDKFGKGPAVILVIGALYTGRSDSELPSSWRPLYRIQL